MDGNRNPLRGGARIASALALGIAAAAARPAFAQPLLDAAFTCGRATTAGRVTKGRDLFRIDTDAAVFPEALCNDGTRAIFYVRRASDPALESYWHVHLQGGGACNTAQDCANRWCSYGTNFGANKMSTRGTPGAIRQQGIFDRAAINSFRAWNQVLVYYCSSDSWAGEGSGVVAVADDPADLAAGVVPPASVTYQIHFRGATIVDAVIDQLRRDCAGVACAPQDYSYGPDKNGDGVPDLEMPDLDEATHVLFSGSSAGSAGVRVHADALGARLSAANVSCGSAGGCALDFRAVIDSGVAPSTEAEPYTTACSNLGAYDWCGAACVAAASCTWDDYMLGNATSPLSITTLAPSRAEDSCAAWHLANDPALATWRCADATHLALNHLSTPYFTRMDEQDELIMRNHRTAGFTSCPAFGAAVEAQSRSLFDPASGGPLDAFAEEGSVATPGNPPLAVPGVFAPRSNDHEALSHRPEFFRVRLEDPPGSGILHSYHDVLRHWFDGGGGPQQLVRPFPGVGVFPPAPPALPYCP